MQAASGRPLLWENLLGIASIDLQQPCSLAVIEVRPSSVCKCAGWSVLCPWWSGDSHMPFWDAVIHKALECLVATSPVLGHESLSAGPVSIALNTQA